MKTSILDAQTDKKSRSLLSRGVSIIVTIIGTFVLIYFTLTTLIKRISVTGVDAFPALWQDWAILASIVPTSFLILISFLALLKDFELRSGRD
ncbi:hypothetical protein QA596_12340 [Balneolales bacterium ANBcel1]|nr:hypothetical protein [Balneolales bacterium ANBcel1]